MLGRTSERITVSRPLKNGVISDFSMAEQLISYYLRQISPSRVFMPRVVVSVPCNVTEVEKRAVVEAITAAGVRKVCLIEACGRAIGAGVDIAVPHGTMIVDIGEGATDMAVISLNGIAVSNSCNIAGADFNDAITKYVRKFNLLIRDRTAEEAKIAIGCAYPRKKLMEFTLKGRNAMTGLPETTVMNSDEMIEALIEPAISIIRTVQETLEATPPELFGGYLHRRHLPYRRLRQPVRLFHAACQRPRSRWSPLTSLRTAWCWARAGPSNTSTNGPQPRQAESPGGLLVKLKMVPKKRAGCSSPLLSCLFRADLVLCQHP